MPYRPAPPTAPPGPTVYALEAGAALPPAGTLVGVPVASATGPPGGSVIAVVAKPWWESATIWSNVAGFLLAVLDAWINVLVPLISSGEPVTVEKVWRPLALALLTVFVTWRRKRDNTVIA